jgi:hypothetical protein
MVGFLIVLNLIQADWTSASEAADITKDKSLKDVPEIEASGIIYLENIDRYLVISDETEDKRPVLYLMNRNGHVKQAVMIQGLDKINDMEAVCKGDNGDIYISSSQSFNKKGKLSDHRKLFIRVERNGTEFYLKNKILLYDLLLDAIEQFNNTDLNWLIPDDTKSPDINIEGIFFQEGDIFLGLKKPLNAGKSVILKIRDINRVLKENRISENDLSVWQTLDLKDQTTGVPTAISDLCLYQNRLFILSYAKIEKDSPLRDTGLKKLGNLWEYDLKQNELKFLKTFQNMQPEGVVMMPDAKTLTIVFDNGGDKPSQFLNMEIPSANLTVRKNK